VKLGDLQGNTAVVICGHAFRKEREIRLVSYDGDGPQATCDLDHRTPGAEADAKLVSLESLFTWEPGLAFLRDLEPGQEAWKSGPDTWTIENTGE
jgi:hypothetical protein